MYIYTCLQVQYMCTHTCTCKLSNSTDSQLHVYNYIIAPSCNLCKCYQKVPHSALYNCQVTRIIAHRALLCAMQQSRWPQSYQKDIVISSVAIGETTDNEDTTDKHHKVHYSCSFLCIKPEYTRKLVNSFPHIHTYLQEVKIE